MTAHCSTTTRVSRIKLDDPKSRRAIFLNLSREEYVRHQVDKCIIVEAIAADWVLSKPGVGDVVVELKGKDVDHAVEQIKSTSKFWKESGRCCGKLAGLVVCNEYPRQNTKIQRAQAYMAKVFKAPLHVVTGDREFSFEKVVRFDGPS